MRITDMGLSVPTATEPAHNVQVIRNSCVSDPTQRRLQIRDIHKRKMGTSFLCMSWGKRTACCEDPHEDLAQGMIRERHHRHMAHNIKAAKAMEKMLDMAQIVAQGMHITGR